MKTDVIFLGAGASCSSGFPVNAGLARYIMSEFLAKARDPVPLKLANPGRDYLREWKQIAETLRETNCLSVDEFCQIGHKTFGDATDIKQLLRLALFDYRSNWWQWNDYVPFIYSLFQPSSADLNPNVSVVNFNYDGVFSKLLTDAVISRRRIKGLPLLSYSDLAPIAGGWYGHRFAGIPSDVATVEEYDMHSFSHVLPHGTITVHTNALGQSESLQETIYCFEDTERVEGAFLKFYYTEPLIRFPWEEDEMHPTFYKLYEHSRQVVELADRVHFIGISGHRLLRQSLSKMFRTSTPDTLAKKSWHIATNDPDPTAVFNKLLDCLLPDRLLNDSEVRRAAHLRLTRYPSFGDWTRSEPHLRNT